MHTKLGCFPEWRWDDYLLIDNWTYRCDPKTFLFVKRFELLPHVQAARVLERIFHEDPALRDELMSTYRIPRYLEDRHTLEAFVDLLGVTFQPFRTELNPFGRLTVMREKRPKPTPPPEYQIKLFEPAPLSAASSWVTIECVDQGEPPRPVPDVQLQLITASAEVRTARTDDKGAAFIDGIAPGRVTIRVMDLDGALWRPLDGADAQPSPTDDHFTWQVVQSDDTLAKIAAQRGFKYWQDIWKHRKNASLRDLRKHPSRIRPGDDLAVPDVPLYEIVRDTEQTHRLQMPRREPRRVFVLSARDLSFHPNSCVFLGECGDLTDPQTLHDTSGIDALASALEHARDNPDRRALIVGYSDATGEPDHNQVLSEKRAQAIAHLLLGQRDPWISLVSEQSAIADYQQILTWLSVVRGWPCAAFDVEGRDAPDNQRILQAFQTAYNRSFSASIAEDGVIGAETWGAIFDVYQEQLRFRLETDEAGFAALRKGFKLCSVQTHGWGSFLAFHGGGPRDGACYRQAQILFFHAGAEPGPAELEPGPLGAPRFALQRIEVQRSAPLVWISVQTVDDLGFRLGNVALVFTTDGHETQQNTDAEGVWIGQVRAGREIEVRRADGGSIRFGSSTASGDKLTIRPSLAMQNVTDLVIVGSASADVVQAQREQLRRYAAVPDSGPRTSRGVLPAGEPLSGEPMEELPAEEGAPRRFTRRLLHSHVADNLLLAAGLDIGALPDVVRTWLADYYPEAARRGFFLQVLKGSEVLIFDQEGGMLTRARLSDQARVAGLMGLYARVETDRVATGSLFVDAAMGRVLLRAGIVRSATSDTLAAADKGAEGSDLHARQNESAPTPGASAAADAEATDHPGAHQNEAPIAQVPDVVLRELVDPRDRDAYLDSWYAQRAAGHVELVYYVPADALLTLARIGGTGLLEPYPTDSVLRSHVHARNQAVASTAGAAYRAYLDTFVARYAELDPSPESAEQQGKPHPEAQLRAIGFPEGGPVFPRPAGANLDEHYKLLEKVGDTTAYRAYQAYTEKYNAIFGIRSAGSVWLAGEVSFERGLSEQGDAAGEVKLNFEINTDQTDGSIQVKAAGKKKLTQRAEVEVDSNGVVTAKVKGGKLGPFELAIKSDGVMKLSYQGVSAAYDAQKQQVANASKFSLRDLVRKAFNARWTEDTEPQWVKKLPDLKVKAELGMQLSRADDVEAALVRVPASFKLKPRHSFHKYHWETLNSWERYALETLGFDQESWDEGSLPGATKQPFSELTPVQRSAVFKYLPLPRGSSWESYWIKVAAEKPASK